MTKARDIASAAPAPSTVSATEIGYLDGVSSAIQTQIDGKSSTSHNHNSTYVANSLVDAKGDLLVGTANDTVSRLAVASTAGYVLTVDSAQATGLKWAASGSSFSGCLVTNSAQQNISNGTDTFLTYDTETYDTDGYHVTSGTSGRLTVPSGKSGYYYVYSLVRWNNNSSGQRTMQITYGDNQDSIGVVEVSAGGTSTYVGTFQGSIRYATAGNYFECKVNQTSGGTLGVRANTHDLFFGIQYVGA